MKLPTHASIVYSDFSFTLDLRTLKAYSSPTSAPFGVSFFNVLGDTADISSKNAYKLLLDKKLEEVKSCPSDISLNIIPTWSCNASCEYCYTKALKNEKKMLTYAELVTATAKEGIAGRTITSTILIGGEPLLNMDLIEEVVKKFPRSCKHTICTSFYVDYPTLTRLSKLLAEYSNLEISLSFDAENSSRYYNISKEKMLDRVGEFWLKHKNQVRIKTTITKDSFLVQSLRDELPTGISIYVDGAAYGTNYLTDISNETADSIKHQFDMDIFHYFAGGRNPFFNYGNLKEVLSGGRANTCSCGLTQFTVSPEGYLTLCDKPSKLILDKAEPAVIPLTKACSTCDYILLCGGYCGISEHKELFCYTRVLHFVYTLFREAYDANKCNSLKIE